MYVGLGKKSTGTISQKLMHLGASKVRRKWVGDETSLRTIYYLDVTFSHVHISHN